VIVVRQVKRGVLGVVLVCVLGWLVGVASASAQSPWWHLSSASRPTYLQPGQAKDEVQEIVASPEELLPGVTTLAFEVSVGVNEVPVGIFATEPLAKENEFPEPTAANLEAALEAVYGKGNVVVAERKEADGTVRLVVTSVGGDADRPVPEIKVRAGVGPVEAKVVGEGQADGVIVVTAVNFGDANANPETQPVVVADELPAGLKAVAIEGAVDEAVSAFGDNANLLECSLGALSCTFTGKSNAPGYPSSLTPYKQIQVRVAVNLESGAKSGEVNEATVTGGGAPPVTVKKPIVVSAAPLPFAVNTYEMRPEEEGGGVDTQAGSHPFQLTTAFSFNETFYSHPLGLTKDLHFKLPPGLIGNPTPFAQCSLAQFLSSGGQTCSAQSVVGVARVTARLPNSFSKSASDPGKETSGEGRPLAIPFDVPLYNLEPAVGEPARFGFIVNGDVPVLLDTAVRTGGDYGVTVNVTNISQEAEFLSSEVTFWGVPGDERHNDQRGICLSVATETAQRGANIPECPSFEAQAPPPLLTLPTSCQTNPTTGRPEPLRSTIETDSWEAPHDVLPQLNTQPMPALDGCNRLQFDPSISVAPDGQAGSTPTGLSVGVHVPQTVSLNPNGLAEADVKNTTVALPQGVALNPAAADGLQACSEDQIALDSAGPSSCPEASKVGLVKIKTPLLPNVLEGNAYVAAQDANPFGSLVALYVFAEDPVSGSRIKLAGEVVPDPVTGQLVSTFKNTPQLPFETFELNFFGGDRAPLGTPSMCGSYTTMASIEPWTDTGSVASNSTFQIASGPNGSQCADPLPFDPSLTVGSLNIQAGAFTPFTTTMSREDGNQNLQGIVLHMPAGVSGLLSGVKLCGEAEANAGTCSSESLIGETVVSVGLGGDPYSVTGGRVYITGPYEGAPFGLSIVNPAKAGPYDLGEVIVRAKIEVNPITAALTVATDDSGPHEIPHILDGIPLQIKHVYVNINRPGFTFNPTNCNPTKITGSLQSTEGASQTLSVPFQVTNCASLAFKPGFAVSTSGRTSRANGASLKVKLTYPKAPFGSQANIKSVKVDLPKQLPSRLTTLQNACPAKTFEANPAGCSRLSIVGHATAITPLIPVPLTGPAYFVSYGGAKFPELVIALQGYGVTLDLHGETFISKAGITSSTFRTVPDAPVGSFELTLPQGKDSALAANGNLCVGKLAMPTAFTAQNGATIKQSTPIGVSGCPKKAKKAKKVSKRRKGSSTHRKKK
jgi:hypothetical protein